MPAKIQAIECPKCGATHKVEIRPGDFRCESCGTEYFIDDGTVKFGQKPLSPADLAGVKRAGRLTGCVLWVVGLLIVFSTLYFSYLGLQKSTKGDDSVKEYTWDAGWGNALYLSADGRPVLLTLGTKTYYGGQQAKADYIAFIDVSGNSTIATLPLPDAASLPHSSMRTNFDVQEYPNGDIFIIAEKTQLFRVRKTSYAAVDVTQSLFEGQPDLVNGVAKLEFIDHSHPHGFSLITNEGKKFFYDPMTGKVYATLAALEQIRKNFKRSADEVRTGFAFSNPFNGDFPDIPEQLITFRYMANPYEGFPQFPYYGSEPKDRWDNAPTFLAAEGVLTHRDFTPGRVYFDYGVLYFDDDYVLISYRPTPARNAPRVVQLLSASTGAILFTTPLDVTYAPDQCIRYKDGFAMVSVPDAYTLSLSGKLEKHTPFMYSHK